MALEREATRGAKEFTAKLTEVARKAIQEVETNKKQWMQEACHLQENFELKRLEHDIAVSQQALYQAKAAAS